MTGSNRRPPACKAEALPTELTMLTEHCHESIANILHMSFFSPLTGAARENRTLNFCLEGSGFTIKLQPHYATFNPLYLSAAYDAANAFGFTSGTTLQVPRM